MKALRASPPFLTFPLKGGRDAAAWSARRILTALALLLACAAPAAAQTVDEGWAAFEDGDTKAAHEIWLELAEAGDAQAQYLVGYLHDDGIAAPHDLAAAARWYRLAAEQGHGYAQFALALLYADGIGVPRDPLEAYRWFMLAADTDDYVDRRDAIAQADNVRLTLSATEVAEAERLIRAWRAAKGYAADEEEPYEPGAGEPWSDGTGFAVGADGYVLTNFHVVDGCARLEVGDGAERDRLARVVATDPWKDLALLKTDRRFRSVARFRSEGVRLGEQVMVAGFPLRHVVSTSFTVTVGIVSALAGVDDNGDEIQISAQVQPGNSGGPLLDRAGRVIGVVSAQVDEWYVASAVDALPQTVNFAVRDSAVKKFLRANRVDFASADGDEPLSTEELAARARAIALVVECYDEEP